MDSPYQHCSPLKSNVQQQQFNEASISSEAALVDMLNNKNKTGTAYNKIKKLIELNSNISYKVMAFKTVNTKHGVRCVAEIFDYFNNQVFDIFLPERFSNTPPSNNLNGVYMLYRGMKDTYRGDQYHDIIFNSI